MSELTEFRKRKDHFFKADPQSPLTAAQKKMGERKVAPSMPVAFAKVAMSSAAGSMNQ